MDLLVFRVFCQLFKTQQMQIFFERAQKNIANTSILGQRVLKTSQIIAMVFEAQVRTNKPNSLLFARLFLIRFVGAAWHVKRSSVKTMLLSTESKREAAVKA